MLKKAFAEGPSVHALSRTLIKLEGRFNQGNPSLRNFSLTLLGYSICWNFREFQS